MKKGFLLSVGFLFLFSTQADAFGPVKLGYLRPGYDGNGKANFLKRVQKVNKQPFTSKNKLVLERRHLGQGSKQVFKVTKSKRWNENLGRSIQYVFAPDSLKDYEVITVTKNEGKVIHKETFRYQNDIPGRKKVLIRS